MVFADLIWPAMYINEGFSAFWVAAFSVVIEAYFFGKAFCCNSPKKSLILSLIANAATAILGTAKITPHIALIATLLHDMLVGATFAPSGWGAAIIFYLFFNSAIEYFAAKAFAKYVLYKKSAHHFAKHPYLLIVVANCITFALAAVEIIKNRI